MGEVNLKMTSDREAKSVACWPANGRIEVRSVPIGTAVTYLGHVVGGMVRVRFDDGTEGVMHPHCFAQLR